MLSYHYEMVSHQQGDFYYPFTQWESDQYNSMINRAIPLSETELRNELSLIICIAKHHDFRDKTIKKLIREKIVNNKICPTIIDKNKKVCIPMTYFGKVSYRTDQYYGGI